MSDFYIIFTGGLHNHMSGWQDKKDCQFWLAVPGLKGGAEHFCI